MNRARTGSGLRGLAALGLLSGLPAFPVFGKAVSTAKLAVREAVVGSSTAEAVRTVGPGLPHFLGERAHASYSVSLSLSSLFCELDTIASCH